MRAPIRLGNRGRLPTGHVETGIRDVKVKPMQLVTPPSPFVSPEAVVGMAVYIAKAMLHGKGRDVWEMVVENIP
jgi:hypothetical protein